MRGDVLEVFPAHEEEKAVRIEWFGDEVESIAIIDPLRGKKIADVEKVAIYPSTHYVTTAQIRDRAMNSIRDELRERLDILRAAGKLLEAQRLEQRTVFDLEMIEQLGYCNGIENYSRHLTGRAPGEPPPTLIDYFPDEYLLVIDESHQTVPQIGAMYRGDRARKETLVNYGFRLPSALDNRPLNFTEFENLNDRVVYVSATPSDYELEQSQGVLVEQIIRPTGLVDPIVEVKKASTQVDDLLEEIRATVEKKARVLVTTLTKRMAEDLAEFLSEAGVRVALSAPLTSIRSSGSRSYASWCVSAPTTCLSASICYAKASTCLRSRSWQSSTPTKKVFCAAAPRSFKRLVALPATSTVASSSTVTR